MFKCHINNMQKMNFIFVMFLSLHIGACAYDLTDLTVTGKYSIVVDRSTFSNIKNAGIYQDEKGQVIRGTVTPANQSHIPKIFSGHIDILVKSSENETLSTGVLKLRSRQNQFAYRLSKPVPEGGHVVLKYFKWSHQHIVSNF